MFFKLSVDTQGEKVVLYIFTFLFWDAIPCIFWFPPVVYSIGHPPGQVKCKLAFDDPLFGLSYFVKLSDWNVLNLVISVSLSKMLESDCI